jgi:hypothetical protein
VAPVSCIDARIELAAARITWVKLLARARIARAVIELGEGDRLFRRQTFRICPPWLAMDRRRIELAFARIVNDAVVDFVLRIASGDDRIGDQLDLAGGDITLRILEQGCVVYTLATARWVWLTAGSPTR